MVNYQLIYLFGQIQTCQTGGHPYNDTSTYKVSEYSLSKAKIKIVVCLKISD